MSNQVFNARVDLLSSITTENPAVFIVEFNIYDGTGQFGSGSIQVGDILYLDTYNINATISKYKVTEVLGASGLYFTGKIEYADTGDVCDPSSLAMGSGSANGYICSKSAIRHLAWHSAPTVHTFADQITQYARDQEMWELIDGISVTGPQGVQGVTGLGVTGLQGSQGNTGIQGTQGITGTQGTAGSQGVTGIEGPIGPQGATGVGTAGAQGATGPAGIGTQGATGVGTAGAQGVTGPAGSAGAQGATGVGTAGAQGATGPAGVGTQGVTGVAGSTGPAGSAGAQGATGPAGVGTQGATGMAGAQGVTGVAGSAGAQGATGPAGVGTQGATGMAGAQGVTGVAGSAGAQGATGVGVAGAQGATGVGTAGAQGVTGLQGAAGSEGPQGSTGVAGIQGVTGVGGGDSPIIKTLTYYSGQVAIRAYGLLADLNNITVTKDFSVTATSRCILTVPANVEILEVHCTMTAAETAGRTQVNIELPEPTGSTSMSTSFRPYMAKWTSTYGFSNATTTCANNSGTLVVAATGMTAATEQKVSMWV